MIAPFVDIDRDGAQKKICAAPVAAVVVELRAAQKSELATVIEALLREIAVALAKAASGESGDDQDHG
jgi:hypothetical protein